MVNVIKLKEEMQKRGITEHYLARRLELNRQRFCDKMEGYVSCFTIKEAFLLTELLDLNGEEAAKIFFCKSRI